MLGTLKTKIIIVHGGGQVISNLLTKNNHSTIKIDGMRVTAKMIYLSYMML